MPVKTEKKRILGFKILDGILAETQKAFFFLLFHLPFSVAFFRLDKRESVVSSLT